MTVASVTSLTKWTLPICLRTICILSEQNHYIFVLLCHQILAEDDADELNAYNTVKIKDIKTEVASTKMGTDCLVYRSDTGNEQNAEEIPLKYSIDANGQNEEENPLQSAAFDPAVMDGFEYVSPPAELILQYLLV